MKDKEENKKPAKKKPLFTFDPSEIEKIPLASLDPAKWNPRKSFDPGPIQDLAKNIEHCGLQQPIIVRKRPEGRYEIIAGERRWRALQLLGASEVPAIVRDMDDLEALKIQMAENVQRQSLNPMEEAEGWLGFKRRGSSWSRRSRKP
jgi:ParB family chromosome partitioning protein